MQKAIDHLAHEFANLRTGRATIGMRRHSSMFYICENPGMFDHLKVDVYGDRMPIKALGTSSVRDAHLAVVTVYDPSTAPAVAKAIEDSPLGLHPEVEGAEVVVRVPRCDNIEALLLCGDSHRTLHRPSKETVAGLMKMAKHEAEGAKVAVRHARKLAMDEIKGMASEDLRRKAEKQAQAVTDEYVGRVDRLLRDKEKELGSVL